MRRMGNRSNQRKFRRRRQRAGFVLFVSLVIVVLGCVLFSRTAPLRETSSGPIARVGIPLVSEAPEAVAGAEANEASGKNEEAAAKKDEAANKDEDHKKQQAAAEQEPAIPVPATNDMWISIPALGLYDVYVTNTSDTREGYAGPETPLDYGLIKLSQTGFPWQPNANTYIVGHRLGWPGTGSYHIFYNLPLLAQGDKIYLGDDNGTTYTYEVTEFHEITPQDTWITAPQAGRNMVSLQTCIENYGDYWTMGPNWYVRYIVQADRVSVDVAK